MKDHGRKTQTAIALWASSTKQSVGATATIQSRAKNGIMFPRSSACSFSSTDSVLFPNACKPLRVYYTFKNTNWSLTVPSDSLEGVFNARACVLWSSNPNSVIFACFESQCEIADSSSTITRGLFRLFLSVIIGFKVPPISLFKAHMSWTSAGTKTLFRYVYPVAKEPPLFLRSHPNIRYCSPCLIFLHYRLSLWYFTCRSHRWALQWMKVWSVLVKSQLN